MSFGGMLATALAGGANVIGKQAGDDIDQQRKTDLMTQQAAIEEQMRMRLAEHNERLRQSGALADVTGPLGDAKFANKVRELAAATDADVDKAKKLSVAGREAAKANAADPDYLKSVSVLKLADPEVRAHIAQMGAAAGASAAETRMRQEQLKQLGEVGKVASTVRSLQAQLARTTDPEQRKAVEQQITDLGFNGKDIKSFLSTAEKAMTNGDTAMKILLDMNASEETKAVARQQLAKANDFAEQAAGLAGIKSGTSGGGYPTPNSAQIDYLKKNPNFKAEFDAKFGKGAADKAIGSQGASGEQKPAAASRSTAVPAQPMPSSASGVDGLSELTLKRIAEDRSNPLQAAAAERLKTISAERNDSNRSRVYGNEAADPALYQ